MIIRNIMQHIGRHSWWSLILMVIKDRIVRITAIETLARHWNDADILIFNSYAWWMYPKLTILWGSFRSPDSIYKTVGKKLSRFEMALDNWSNWLEMNINRTKTKLFFMSFSLDFSRSTPAKQCYNISEPASEEYNWSRTTEDMINIVDSTLQKLETRGLKIDYLQITRMSAYRTDAHPSIYRMFVEPVTEENKKDPTSYADCLHSCLPGVPDTWNEILYNYIVKY